MTPEFIRVPAGVFVMGGGAFNWEIVRGEVKFYDPQTLGPADLYDDDFRAFHWINTTVGVDDLPPYYIPMRE
jgi:hypothetical protein